MSSTEGRYTYSSLVIGLHFLLFFLGAFAFEKSGNEVLFNYAFIFLTFFLAIFISVGLSFLNRTLIGGFIIGITLSSSYWIGFLTGTLINFPGVSSLEAIGFFGVYALTVSVAFGLVGLFFGMLGYISSRLFVENPIVETYIFRDYWSNIYSLGKNTQRELRSIDRRLTRIHLALRDWWSSLIKKVMEPKPELIFVHQDTVKIDAPSEDETGLTRVGDVFDIASGKMLYSNVLDPQDLVSDFRPSIIDIPATSSQVSGGRRLALQEFVSRFLGWFIESKILWVSYLLASMALEVALLSYFEGYASVNSITLADYDLLNITLTCLLLSAMTLLLIYRFRRLSLDLFRKRPDERLLLFSIYLILFLLYGMYYQVVVSIDAVILNELSLFEIGPAPWFIWIEWLILLSLVLGVAYIFIHRESELSNVYLYDNNASPGDKVIGSSFREEGDNPFWLGEKDGTGLYWVLRFMYFWHYELAVIPHPDWERVEVWVDAKTGDAKWIVSDYHYRELWYRVEGDIKAKGLIVGFLANFHTPIPFIKPDEIDSLSTILEQGKRKILTILVTGKIPVEDPIKSPSTAWTSMHPPKWIEKYGLTGLAADFCSKLKWSYWRYPWGIDDLKRYSTYPSAVIEEQPNTGQSDVHAA